MTYQVWMFRFRSSANQPIEQRNLEIADRGDSVANHDAAEALAREWLKARQIEKMSEHRFLSTEPLITVSERPKLELQVIVPSNGPTQRAPIK